MSHTRPLLALFLVVLYAAASILGVGFVVCVEAGGTPHVETLGASCCARVDAVSAAARPTVAAACSAVSKTAGRGEDHCEGCSTHQAAVDLRSPRSEERRERVCRGAAAPAPQCAASPAQGVFSVADLRAPPREGRPPPRPSPLFAHLRSVNLRC